MKKLITLNLLFIFLSSCSTDIQTNVLSSPSTYCDIEETEVCEIDFSSSEK